MLFISYRSSDARTVDHVEESLKRSFGPEFIFRDCNRITPGQDFRHLLEVALERSRIVVAIVGPTWVRALKEHAQTPEKPDYVLFELERALELDLPIVPVLIDGAVPLNASELPATLARLAERHAAVLSHPDSDSELQRLAEVVRKLVAVDCPAYLSGADRQIEPYFSAAEFDRNLFLNLLLQPGLVVTDAYFFYSNHLQRHLPLIKAGLRDGLIAPYFRNDHSSFRDALKDIRAANIEARLGDQTRAKADDRAAYFDGATLSPTFRPRVWPKWNLGEAYRRHTEQLLMVDTPPTSPWVNAGPSPSEELAKVWELSKPWRFDAVSRAIEITKSDAGSGLRRSALITAISESIAPGLAHPVEDMEALCQLLSGEKQRALRCFFRWLNDIYYYGQARAFRASLSFPVRDPLEGAMVVRLLGMVSATAPRADDHINLRVSLPTVERLASLPHEELLAVRKDAGGGYLQAVREWQRTPTSGGASEVERALRHYTLALRKLAAAHPHRDWNVSLAQAPEALLGTAFGASALAMYSPLASFLVAGAGIALYSWANHELAVASASVTLGPGSAAIPADVNIQPTPQIEWH